MLSVSQPSAVVNIVEPSRDDPKPRTPWARKTWHLSSPTSCSSPPSSSVTPTGADLGRHHPCLWQNCRRQRGAHPGEPPYPEGNQATYQGPSAALVAVHENANLVSQFSVDHPPQVPHTDHPRSHPQERPVKPTVGKPHAQPEEKDKKGRDEQRNVSGYTKDPGHRHNSPLHHILWIPDPADRNAASATSALWTARSVWTKAPSPKAQLPATSESPTWRRCQFEGLVRQLPPFARNSGLLLARGKHKQYALGDRTVRFASVIIWIVAVLLIACSPASTSPAPQVGNETSTDARPLSATTTTGLPTTTTATETTPAQPVPSATVGPPNLQTPTAAPEAQPETATAQNATPQEPTATATTTTVLRVTVSAVPATLPDCDRQDWKHWTDADRDCQDARNEVLIAESRTAVAYRTDRKCRVTTGEWLAPYSNTVVVDPGRLDVDHMVPLGNAHDSGAWNWSANRREQYANYLDDPQHLIAVKASANRSKGARGPEE